MTQNIDILTELDPNNQKKPKYFTILIYLFIAYISEILTFSLIPAFNFTLQAKSVEWETIFFILLLPVVGLILFFQKIKIGWAISLFYYSAVSIFLVVIFVQNYLKEGIDFLNLQRLWRGYILALTALISFYLLLSRKVRYYLNIKTKSFVTTLIICIVLILAFILVMENN
jgi:hypothetical protein